MGEPVTRGDISRDEVASRAGSNLRNLVGTRDKGKIIQAMTDGLTAWVSDLYAKGKIEGVIALGGGQGYGHGNRRHAGASPWISEGYGFHHCFRGHAAILAD